MLLAYSTATFTNLLGDLGDRAKIIPIGVVGDAGVVGVAIVTTPANPGGQRVNSPVGTPGWPPLLDTVPSLCSFTEYTGGPVSLLYLPGALVTTPGGVDGTPPSVDFTDILFIVFSGRGAATAVPVGGNATGTIAPGGPGMGLYGRDREFSPFVGAERDVGATATGPVATWD